MDNPNPYGRPTISRREKVALAVAGIVVLAVSFGVARYMILNKPRPTRRTPPAVVLAVKIQEVASTSRPVTIPVQGTVVPESEVDLKARVGGEIIWTSANFVEGGIVRKGKTLLRIDPTDYELALIRSRANLEAAVLDLKTEEGRQEIARTEWEILGLEENASDLDRELALRRPQLATAEARLEAARADVKQAELNLARTEIRAPFNAAIRSVNVDVGAQASAQAPLARLAGSDTFFVEALIPVDRLVWIHIPEDLRDQGSVAQVDGTNGRTVKGEVFKLLPDLQPGGLQARILLKMDDPLDLSKSNGERSPLLLGDYVRARIEGKVLKDVFEIQRGQLRDGGKLYLVNEESRLEIRSVNIVWSETDNVYVRGLEDGERLIVSDIPAPVQGMELRVSEQE